MVEIKRLFLAINSSQKDTEYLTSLSFTPINVKYKNIMQFFVNTLEIVMVELKKKKHYKFT